MNLNGRFQESPVDVHALTIDAMAIHSLIHPSSSSSSPGGDAVPLLHWGGRRGGGQRGGGGIGRG